MKAQRQNGQHATKIIDPEHDALRRQQGMTKQILPESLEITLAAALQADGVLPEACLMRARAVIAGILHDTQEQNGEPGQNRPSATRK